MKKQTILLLWCSIFSMVLCAQSAKPLKITVLNPVCKGSCNGRIRVDLSGNTVLPLTITLSDGRGKIVTTPNVFKSTDFNNLCAGSWNITASSETVKSCKPIFETVVIPSVAFNIRTVAIVNPLPESPNQGSITVEGYAQTETGQFINQGYTYSYLWSNGATTNKIQNLNAGAYSVTVTNRELGCQMVGTFVLKNCISYTPTFNLQIADGIASKVQRKEIPLSVYIQESPNTSFIPVPNGYTIEWRYGNTSIFASSISIPIGLAPLDVKVIVTDPCGAYKEQTIRAVTCDNSSEELKKYFISKINPPCIGQSDGSAILEFSLTNGEGAQLFINDGASTESIPLANNNIVGGKYQVMIPGLRGNRTYLISGFTGYDCDVSFSFTLPEKETEKVCSGYDKKLNLCIYNEECNGSPVGPPNNYKSPAYQIVDDNSARGWFDASGLKALPRCRSDLYCLCSGKDTKVEDGSASWKTSRIGEYWQALEEFYKANGDNLSGRILGDKSPCGHVTYCTLDPRIIDGTWNLLEKQVGQAKPLGNGCFEFKCRAFGIFGSKFKACIANVPPAPPKKPLVVIGTRDCNYPCRESFANGHLA